MDEARDVPEGDDDSVFEGVPDNIRSLIDHVGFIEADEPDILEVIKPMTEGRCMTCGTELGDTTAVIVNNRGICAAYCGGPCMQDMAILGYLQESYDDIRDRVNFRSGNDADQAE